MAASRSSRRRATGNPPHTSKKGQSGNARREYKPKLEALEARINLSPAAIPRHYDHIRVAQLDYYHGALDSAEEDILRGGVDLVIHDGPFATQLQEVEDLSPSATQLIYTNVSNMYRNTIADPFGSWLKYADDNHWDRETAFLHVAAPTNFKGAGGSSQPVSYFWGVYLGTSLQDRTDRASGKVSGGVSFAGTVGEVLYIGYPDRFREISIDIATPRRRELGLRIAVRFGWQRERGDR